MSDLNLSDLPDDWMDDLLKYIRKLKELNTVYYANTDYLDLEPNQIIVVPESTYAPRYIIIRTADIDNVKGLVKSEGMNFIHIRDIDPEITQDRLNDWLMEKGKDLAWNEFRGKIEYETRQEVMRYRIRW